MNRQGFTLIEVLIVIAIIGILAAIGIVNYSRWRASSAVMEGAQQFAQAVSATRTGAKRANVCWQISVTPNSINNKQYQIIEYDGPVCSTISSSVRRTRTYSMPAGTAVTRIDKFGNIVTNVNEFNVNFKPPYGTSESSASIYEVKWSANTEIKRTLRVTGVFGKVVVK